MPLQKQRDVTEVSEMHRRQNRSDSKCENSAHNNGPLDERDNVERTDKGLKELGVALS